MARKAMGAQVAPVKRGRVTKREQPESPPPTRDLPKLLVTVDEAASMLSIGRRQCYALVMAGEIRSLKLGASRRIPVEALQAWVNAMLTASA